MVLLKNLNKLRKNDLDRSDDCFKNKQNEQYKLFKHTRKNYRFFNWANKLVKRFWQKLSCFTKQTIFVTNLTKNFFYIDNRLENLLFFLLTERFYWTFLYWENKRNGPFTNDERTKWKKNRTHPSQKNYNLIKDSYFRGVRIFYTVVYCLWAVK